MNGWKTEAWYQRMTSSSDSGLKKKPAISAPMNVMPVTECDRSMAMEIFKCSHLDMLSPVQTAAVR